MSANIVPGCVYTIKGRHLLVVSLQLTATGNGHGDMLLIATLSDGTRTWTEDVTDIPVSLSEEYAVTLSKIAGQSPLNEPFWKAVSKANVGTCEALTRYLSATPPAKLEEWALLLFDTIVDDVKDLGFCDLADCTYSRQAKQLIMWWIRRTAMARFRDRVPMGGGTIADEAAVVQTSGSWPGQTVAMAGRMKLTTGSSVPNGFAPKTTVVFEKQHCGCGSTAAMSTFEAFLVSEPRSFGDHNFSVACLKFLTPSDPTPWQIAQGYLRTFDADIWASGGCVTPPNSPMVMTTDGKQAGQEATSGHVDAVWPRMVDGICDELKWATMDKLRAIKRLESEWIGAARRAVLKVMRARDEFQSLFRIPMAESNAFYPQALRDAAARLRRY